ncbi:MAG: ABC transporter permease subunit [Chloroflexi bacterium]|nr:ABC transporter permease subunit [Chloroflexota bacterium]
MLRYLTQRALAFIPTLLGVSILIFVAIRLVPGDAVTAMLGIQAGALTDAQRASLQAYFGLDKPAPVQYFIWLGGLLHGDLGLSMRYGSPVLDLILSRFPTTVELAILALVIALLVGIPLGIISAIRRDTFIDLFARLFALFGLAIPNFLFGTLLIYVLSVYFHYLPNSGDFISFGENPGKNLQQMIFPAITLGFAFSASVMRTTRSAMLEVLGQDYIRTARSKGLDERIVISRHALRNALIPVLTITGVELGYLLGGAVIVEEIFALPGIGRVVLNAISQRDYAVVQGVALFIALIFVVVNLLIDVIYVAIDPRISYASEN